MSDTRIVVYQVVREIYLHLSCGHHIPMTQVDRIRNGQEYPCEKCAEKVYAIAYGTVS